MPEYSMNENDKSRIAETDRQRQSIREILLRKKALNLKVLIAIMLAIALLLVAVIIGTVRDGGVEPADITGSYELEAVEGNGDTGNLENMKSLGMTITLDVREDGTATMDLAGQRTEITYDADDMTMNIDGSTIPFRYKDDKLRIEQNGLTMVFAR